MASLQSTPPRKSFWITNNTRKNYKEWEDGLMIETLESMSRMKTLWAKRNIKFG